ncbi:MAG TPA: DNA topoisomerase IV subunit A [Enteractinococcus helveticum]|uniref:DNA topoisomerase (ATP-hydrolyzing) n=1 Tax=Enteractinococcus helveticum TaxID=1837282 RepID=A0A921K8J4_9MICC|nr:DNA topoisomerase IV subunit A [Enteractinococcus helveticum]HJF15668.1 DNA topoisomerase IV subunit A [Enteractinococcus helveticum]
MSKRSKSKTSGNSSTAVVPTEDQNIIDIDVASEMEHSFLEYAYSVIYSRALPDARDGLKPVQRRILYMMNQMGLTPDKGHVKSARVVGEVMGKLHPHGDSAIYDAMVRLAQDFNLRLPLVDGHGNFGSLDDGPAAARYTEARMSQAAVAMTADLTEDTVDFEPNYDNQMQQPSVLPAAFPNLLVNGAAGIAVGMATNMAPHNLGEVIAAARHLLKYPEADTKALMKFVPGPDLPSGARIVGLDGIKEAYETGRGRFTMRATVNVEQVSARRTGLVVTELPYGVGPERIIDRLKIAVNAKKVVGIADVVDLTDRHNGMQLVIELKAGFNPQAVLAQLYKHTPLEENFGINNVALVDGQPQTLGLKDLLSVYVDHRLTVVRRRTAHRLGKRKDRLHLVEGLLLALVDIDEVIEIIRTSDDAAAARQRLMMVFDLTEIQANHILELRLRQLTKFSRIDLETERDDLLAAIEALEKILGSDAVLRETVSNELAEIAEKFNDPRRTKLVKSEELAPAVTASSSKADRAAAASALLVPDDPCWVVLSASGRLLRTKDQTPLTGQGRRRRHDVYTSVVATTARGEVGALTDTGRIIRLNVVEIPALQEATGTPAMTDGVKIRDFITVQRGEKIIAIVPLNRVLALGTRNGVVKRVRADDWPLNQDEFEAITLKDGDTVVGAAAAPEDNDQLVFVTESGQLLRFAAELVRPQGRSGGGIAGIKLVDNDQVLSFNVAPALELDESVVVTVTKTDDGMLEASPTAKVTTLEEFAAKGRNTQGVRAHRFLRGEIALELAWAGPHPLASTTGGVARALPQEHSERDASGIMLDSAIGVIGRGTSPVLPSQDVDQD